MASSWHLWAFCVLGSLGPVGTAGRYGVLYTSMAMGAIWVFLCCCFLVDSTDGILAPRIMSGGIRSVLRWTA